MRLILFIVQLLVVKFVSLWLRKLAYGFCLDHLLYAFTDQSCSAYV
jgi:hypothetical protein